MNSTNETQIAGRSSEQDVPDAVASPVRRAATDSLATGLVFMLTLTVVQRMVGFVRSILFCSLLQDDELGRWSLAFSFLFLAAPLAVVGLPGSFGRYVEYYRTRGQLGTFLRRTIFVCIGLVALAEVVLSSWGSFWAWLVLGDPSQASMMRLLSVALIAIIAYNFATELLTAMRKVRAVAIMQFVSSILFAILAITLLKWTSLREEGIVIAFSVASLIAIFVVAGPLCSIRSEASRDSTPLSQRGLWEKLVPFAAWVWLTNILANLFDAADRFMIIHFAKDGAFSADALVGQYHASRVVPYLLVAVASMAAGVILPYLSHDWEEGDRESVSRRQRLTIKLGALILTTCGALILIASPILFTWILHGKYDQGLTVLPWTLTYCIWFSLIVITQNYLWCAERARLGTLAFFIGLCLNLIFNAILLPRFGLIGAIVATAVGNAVALVLILYFSRSLGLVVDRCVVLCCCLPCTLVITPWLTVASLIALAFLAVTRAWIFDAGERGVLREVAMHYVSRLPRLGKKRPAASV